MADWEWLYAEDVADELLTFRLAQASSSRMASCAGSRRAIRECAAQVPHFLDVWLCTCDIRNVRVTSLQFVRSLPYYLVLPWSSHTFGDYCDLCHHPRLEFAEECASAHCWVDLCAFCSSHLAGVGRVCGQCKHEHLDARADNLRARVYEHVPGSSNLMQWLIRRYNVHGETVQCARCNLRDRRFDKRSSTMRREEFHERMRAAAAPPSSQNTAFADRRTALAKKLCFQNGPVNDIAGPARTLILSYL
jgi:hypothetical protein